VGEKKKNGTWSWGERDEETPRIGTALNGKRGREKKKASGDETGKCGKDYTRTSRGGNWTIRHYPDKGGTDAKKE